MPEILLVVLAVVVAILERGFRGRLRGLSEQNQRLEDRVLDLESRLDDALGHEPRPKTVPPTPVASPARVVEPTAEVGPARAEPATPRPSLEAFLGGRVMLVVGVIVVLLGLAFFLKVAIDKGWLAPGARIAMGVTAGLALLVGGDRLRTRGLTVFGHGLMGGGLGALYLSDYFAAAWFGFLDQTTAFALVAGVTALGAWLAVWRDAQLLAWLGFLGAFLAPALLGRNVDALESLTAWLVVVDLGLLAVLTRRSWPRMELMALVASAFYFGSWYQRWFEHAGQLGVPDRLGVACGAISALLAALLALTLVPPLVRKSTVGSTALATSLIAGGLAFWAAHDMLFPETRGALGAAVLVVGSVYVLVGRWLSRRRGAPGADTDTLDAFGLVALAVAIPVLLEGDALTPAWALTGAAAVYAGSRMQRVAFQFGGLGLVLLSAGQVLTRRLPLHQDTFVPLMNMSFLTALSPSVGLVLSARFMKSFDSSVVNSRIRTPLLLAGTWLLALLLGIELHDHFILDADHYGAAFRDYGLSAASVGLALCSVAFAILLGRGKEPLPAASAVPLVFALLAASVVNIDGVRTGFSPLMNAPFGAGLLVTVAAALVGRVLRGNVGAWAFGAALLFSLVLITSEVHTYGRLGSLDSGTREEARFRAQVYISVAWGLYAAVLLTLGFLRDQKGLRWAALTVFALTLGKVLLVDMARLETVYRIGSFLAVGVLLVSASLFYQRARGLTEQPTAPSRKENR